MKTQQALMNPTSPVHWCRMALDPYATVYIKDPDLSNFRITYKVLSLYGMELEPTRTSIFSVEGDWVVFDSIQIPWVEFIRIIDVLIPS